VLRFHDWFTGSFWREWVVARRNKPTEVKSKEYIYERHLKPAVGEVRIDQIRTSDVAAFRAVDDAHLVDCDLRWTG
jgi:hypothetical protein